MSDKSTAEAAVVESAAAADAVAATGDEAAAVPAGFTEVREGQAKVLFSSGNVFYNNVQEFNRDLSTCAIKAFHAFRLRELAETRRKKLEKMEKAGNSTPLDHVDPKLRIVECLSASGLRSIRYFKELPGLIDTIVANDLCEDAVQTIERNVVYNGLSPTTQVIPSHNDANTLLHSYLNLVGPRQERPHVVDLDPYGTAAPFLDAAVQAVDEGGLLAVTCTDMAVLCGSHPEACFAKYGAVSLRSSHHHEQALRLILGCMDTVAARYKRYIVPLLALSIDFYARVFVRVYSSAAECKESGMKRATLYQCGNCSFHVMQPMMMRAESRAGNTKFAASHGPPVGTTCPECASRMRMGGPLWSGPLHNDDFVAAMEADAAVGAYGTYARMQGMLAVVREELPDTPLFYVLPDLLRTVRSSNLTFLQFRSAILQQKYRVSSTHAHMQGIKTDAPASVLHDIIRNWVKLHPVRAPQPGSSAETILAKTPAFETDFETIHPDANPPSRKNRLKRFQINPEANWGPKARAKRTAPESEESKSTEEGSGAAGSDAVPRGRRKKRARLAKKQEKGDDKAEEAEGDGDGDDAE